MQHNHYVVVLLFVYYVFEVNTVPPLNGQDIVTSSLLSSRVELVDPVRVDLFVMSKCPDANYCEALYDGVVSNVGSIINLHVNYIAKYDGTTFTCLHGQSECEGNLQQLCVYHDNGPNDYKWWSFIQCQDEQMSNIPSNGPMCALREGLSWDRINACATGEVGSRLLVDSIQFTDSLSITTSCTIYINNVYYCVRDGGKWINCSGTTVDSVVNDVCSLYQGSQKPPACTPQQL